MRVPQLNERINERIKEAPAQLLRGVFAGIGQLLLVTDKLRNKTPAAQQTRPARAPEPPKTAASTGGETAGQDEAPASVQPEAEPTVKLQQAWKTSEAEPTPEVPPTVKLLQASEAQQARDAQQAQQARESQNAPEAQRAPGPPETPPARRTPKAQKAPEIKDYDKTGNVRLLGTGEGGAAKTGSGTENKGATPAGDAAVKASGEAEPPLPNYDELSVASLRARLRNLDLTQVRQLIEYEKGHAGRADILSMFERRISKLEAGD